MQTARGVHGGSGSRVCRQRLRGSRVSIVCRQQLRALTRHTAAAHREGIGRRLLSGGDEGEEGAVSAERACRRAWLRSCLQCCFESVVPWRCPVVCVRCAAQKKRGAAEAVVPSLECLPSVAAAAEQQQRATRTHDGDRRHAQHTQQHTAGHADTVASHSRRLCSASASALCCAAQPDEGTMRHTMPPMRSKCTLSCH